MEFEPLLSLAVQFPSQILLPLLLVASPLSLASFGNVLCRSDFQKGCCSEQPKLYTWVAVGVLSLFMCLFASTL